MYVKNESHPEEVEVWMLNIKKDLENLISDLINNVYVKSVEGFAFLLGLLYLMLHNKEWFPIIPPILGSVTTLLYLNRCNPSVKENINEKKESLVALIRGIISTIEVSLNLRQELQFPREYFQRVANALRRSKEIDAEIANVGTFFNSSGTFVLINWLAEFFGSETGLKGMPDLMQGSSLQGQLAIKLRLISANLQKIVNGAQNLSKRMNLLESESGKTTERPPLPPLLLSEVCALSFDNYQPARDSYGVNSTQRLQKVVY
jgi:hypothetical protein